jgi:hypothetical protein
MTDISSRKWKDWFHMSRTDIDTIQSCITNAKHDIRLQGGLIICDTCHHYWIRD